MSDLLQYLSYPFMQRALIGGALIAINCGLLGPFVVLQRLSVLSDGYGHIALTGVALGILLNINPIITVFVVVLLGSVVVHRLMRRNVFGEAAVSLLISFGVASSVIIIGIARGFNTNLYSYLIGSIFTLAPIDILYIVIACAITALCLALFYRDIFILTFNAQLAYLTRKRIGLARAVFTTLIAINVVIAIRAVGILLVSSMLVIPSLIALKIAPSMRGALIYSSISALLSLLAGIIAALLLDIPPSGAIVLILLLLFAIIHCFSRSHG